MWFILFGFLFAICSGQNQQELCKGSSIRRCEKLLTSVNFFPRDEEQFEPVCSIMKQFLACLKTGEEVCHEPIFKSNDQYEGIVRLMDNICDNNTLLHYAYMVTAPCFEYLADNYTDVCIDSKPDLFWDYHEWIEMLILNIVRRGNVAISKTSGTEHLDFWKLLCLNQIYFISCAAEYASLQCSSYGQYVTVEIAREIYYANSICAARGLQELSPVIPNLDLEDSLKLSLLLTLEYLNYDSKQEK
ncbi:uncharacterized protein LOC118187252 [Stegodyphus dumicola]|uniref:uncharacterized protein LOC118187252 n=1 Tax=Stegodyphus dumicola TaxID=202533 RepID=UPI0015A9D66B|nr:uncharacterized protein LOC118187252 [Stegodyphus dumicola]